MIQPGDILDDIYRVDSEIGQGGVGIIYLGYHLRLHKQIVIKLIKDNFVGKIKERSEVDILKQLHHTNLPQVYDFIQKDKEVFTVMDYIEGEDLGSYLKSKKQPEEKQVFLWMNQLCEVLEYLHTRKPAVIHNDIKPQNIMLRPDGSICLLDFNISFDKENRVISGYTRRYASPELIKSNILARNGEDNSKVQVDERSDVYSVGATMYHLVSGNAPDSGAKAVPDLRSMNLPYSKDLLRIIMKARSFSPEERYATVSEMLGDLRNIVTRDKDLRSLKRKEKIYYVFSFGLLALGAVGIFLGMKNIQEEKFLDAYQSFVESVQEEDYEEILEQGIAILNDKKYQEPMKYCSEETANIFYVLADCYFEEKMYQEAGTYYEKAIAITPDHADYYRDYAIAEARQEHIDKAEEVLEQAKEQGLTSDGISLVEAEILLAGNNYEDAVGLFRKVLDTTENQYLKTRTYLLYARALRESGDGESEITVLEEARSYTEGADQNAVIRTLGAAYIRNGKKKDTRKAVECFEILQESGFATYHDSLNLASLYQKEKEFQKEKDILEKMKTDYPQDYQVFMQLAFLSCAEEGEKKEEERDYTETEKYYKKAVNLYEKKKSSGETDLNMENLELTMSQLYEKGWLEK